MPMTVPGMKGAIIAAIGNQPIRNLDEFAEKMATAIVGYIQANATVVPTALIAPPGGGAVTGVGTVT